MSSFCLFQFFYYYSRKIDYKLFALFVFTKGLAKTSSVLCFAHHRALCFHYRYRHQCAASRPCSAWIFPRPQNWFQSLLNNRELELWWKEDLRVSPQTYDHIDLSSSWTIKISSDKTLDFVKLFLLPSMLQF